eukprot:m.53386 g.53386  ORF g.53386 m.53386 type:complete len:403 (-) comp12378_c0_seq2:88-1296(-)
MEDTRPQSEVPVAASDASDASGAGHTTSDGVAGGQATAAAGRRPQFGERQLTDESKVFNHNAWDNVAWTSEHEAQAKAAVARQKAAPTPAEKKEELLAHPDQYWHSFYQQHANRFFKDRHWLFTEFPELMSPAAAAAFAQNGMKRADHRDSAQGDGPPTKSSRPNEAAASDQPDGAQPTAAAEADAATPAQAQQAQPSPTGDLGCFSQHATRRVLEVGCGAGNTVFPLLAADPDPGLFVYACDFAASAVDIVLNHNQYNPRRCHAFVCDIASTAPPLPEASLDVVVLIFVLSALKPETMPDAIARLARCLKPGGLLLFRDYGRYDLAQLRFKGQRLLDENFYSRGDGTCVYFFTKDEIEDIAQSAGLEVVQTTVDRRLIVNRAKKLQMQRVWIQGKYRKPEA